MPINYVVKPGDCISSIAFEHGFFADTIWNYPANAELKRKRKDPNTLCEGDLVLIPDKREKNVNKPTGEMHKFRLNNTPALCSLQLFDQDEYRSNQSYELEIDGRKLTGKTDAEGVLRVSIPPNARSGILTIGEEKSVFNLQFGHIEPPNEIRGVQARLQNLGYDCPINGELDEETRSALRNFQYACELKETGEIDSSTLQKLDELHDNVCDIPNRDEVKSNDDGYVQSSNEIETPFEEDEKDETENQDENDSQDELKDPEGNEAEEKPESSESNESEADEVKKDDDKSQSDNKTGNSYKEDEKSENEGKERNNSQNELKDSNSNEPANESETAELEAEDEKSKPESQDEDNSQSESKDSVDSTENESENETENDEVKKDDNRYQPRNRAKTSNEEDEKAETESQDEDDSQNELKDSKDNESENESDNNESEEEIKA